MRSTLLAVFLACGGSPAVEPDAGTADAGTIDPPVIACDAGVMLCLDGVAWSCTLSGNDAVFVSSCPVRDINGIPTGVHGVCSEQPCATGASLGPVGGTYDQAPDGGAVLVGAVYCCAP